MPIGPSWTIKSYRRRGPCRVGSQVLAPQKLASQHVNVVAVGAFGKDSARNRDMAFEHERVPVLDFGINGFAKTRFSWYQ